MAGTNGKLSVMKSLDELFPGFDIVRAAGAAARNGRPRLTVALRSSEAQPDTAPD
ncbi:hypothetical protein F444_19548 [Phytophthora nicotianae P1976]|uniref:Uncharacterized protein n=1 Tax=Phytophthora nicotianae P1976 TaxID=1317066 RepID=A0A080Z7E2_PHYNI|nr:hypothetical protein F444_19548 [Phytophthora nicotianae P1976]